MPQFAPGTVVCSTHVLLSAMAEYRVTSVLSDEGLLKEVQGRQYSKKLETMDATIPPL